MVSVQLLFCFTEYSSRTLAKLWQLHANILQCKYVMLLRRYINPDLLQGKERKVYFEYTAAKWTRMTQIASRILFDCGYKDEKADIIFLMTCLMKRMQGARFWVDWEHFTTQKADRLQSWCVAEEDAILWRKGTKLRERSCLIFQMQKNLCKSQPIIKGCVRKKGKLDSNRIDGHFNVM